MALERKAALETAVNYVIGCGVPGDVAEFGCWFGATAAILATAMAQAGLACGNSDAMHGIPERKLWVLDSFEGFPEAKWQPDRDAPHIQAGVWRAGSPAGGSPDAVREHCGAILGAERVKVVPGWFKDSLPTLPRATRFALLHIDCDYYESTFQVLNHLFYNDMVADGCTILFDDWYCNRGSPNFGEQRAWRETVATHKISFSDWGGYDFAGRRMIVHK